MPLTLTTGYTFTDGDVVTRTKLNNAVNAATYTGSLEVAKGGTGSTSAGDARTALGVPAATDVLLKASNLSDLANAATARTNLGVSATTDVLLKANNLSDVADAATARANLGVGETRARATSQFDKTDETYADVTGLTVNLVSGTTYTLEAWVIVKIVPDVGVPAQNNVTGKLRLTGTATASSIAGSWQSANASGGTVRTQEITALPSAYTELGITGTAATQTTFQVVYVVATIACNGNGTLKFEFAKNNSVAGTASVMLGSFMRVFTY